LEQDKAESHAETPEEADFWAAVEREDAASLASTLDIKDDDPGLRAVLPALAAWRRQHRERSSLERLRYQVTWKPLPDRPAPARLGHWLVVVPADSEAATPYLDGLTACGARLTTVTLDDLTTPDQPVDGVLSLLALGEDGLGRTAALVQALGAAGIGAPLWCATRGAVSTGPSDRLDNPDQAQVWGLGRVVGLEYPGRWGGLVDLPANPDDRAVDRLAAILASPDGDDQVAVRAAGVYGRRLAHAPLAATPGDGWRPDGTVLVTGGTGALGGHVARWLACRGAPHLLLLSRSGPDAPAAADLRSDLEALGATVTIEACDIGDRAALAAALVRVPADRPLTAVFHTAGVLDDGILPTLTPDRYATVLRPKVEAARHLHELTRDLELSAFVLFSSLAGTLGNAGQGNYAAANAYLDALAEHRRADGLPATSIAWGAWADGGLVGEGLEEALRQRGIRVMPPDLAVAALQHALDAGEVTVGIADVDWSRFLPAFTEDRPSPLLAELAEARRLAGTEPAATRDDSGAVADWRRRLVALPDTAQRRELRDLVRTHVASALGHASPADVEPDRALRELGFDSLAALQVRNRLRSATGLALPATVVFDHPTPDALARYLHAQLVAGPSVPADDASVRRALADIPLDRLRRAGLLDTLLELAGPAEPQAVTTGGDDHPEDLIDTLDADSLVRMAFGTATPEEESR
jgi:NADP-dependent 3-hydroxy acid dehydrogenase YdfG/acyl carrier protein